MAISQPVSHRLPMAAHVLAMATAFALPSPPHIEKFIPKELMLPASGTGAAPPNWLPPMVQSLASTDPIKGEFQRLASEWSRDRRNTSSLTRIQQHPAYLKIIEMGHKVVPYILAELERKADFWFAALQEITGEDPATVNDRGRIFEMRKAWLRWGREKNVIW